MRHGMLAVSLAVGLAGCFEANQGVSPVIDPSASPGAVEPSPEASSTPAPLPLPRPLLPFVKRLAGVDRLLLYEPIRQEIVEIPEGATGGPILNPSYFEDDGEGRILYNSGGGFRECPEGSGIVVPELTTFGAYVLDLRTRLRLRLSDDDYFHSVVTADGRLFAHLDKSDFPPPQEIELVLEGEDPLDKAIVARLGLEPGVLVDVSIDALGRWLAAVKGPALAPSCLFPPPVAGQLYLYDLATFDLIPLPVDVSGAPLQAASLSPSGRQIILRSDGRLVRFDRETGLSHEMPVLEQYRGAGRFREVRFLAASETVFYLEYLPPSGPCRILSYDWSAERLSPVTAINQLDVEADMYLAPPY